MVNQIELVRMTGIQSGALSWAAHFISAVNTSGPQTVQKNPVGLTMASDLALLQGSTVPLGTTKLVKLITNI